MTRKSPVAVPAALALLALAAPAANAAAPTVTVSHPNANAVAFTIDPAGSLPVTSSAARSMVFIDADGAANLADAASTVALIVRGTGSAAELGAARTPNSSPECQQLAGTGSSAITGVNLTVADDLQTATVTVPSTEFSDTGDFYFGA